ncbi:hypothetical protein NDU88_005186 [Pleurodeles waltl]|uniref:Uncharacterized protein n=1 Tax=Pleurodeles waltl TaxID=8319 RepID=A0AAV7TTM2_PLEWA|nr:hypothetical protein NDU88_005186 [Pleurodeles waltl]
MVISLLTGIALPSQCRRVLSVPSCSATITAGPNIGGRARHASPTWEDHFPVPREHASAVGNMTRIRPSDGAAHYAPCGAEVTTRFIQATTAVGYKPSNPTCWDSSEKRSERGGRLEHRTEYVEPRHESQRSTEVSAKKEEKPPQQKPQFKKKKVAAVAVRHATQEEGSLEEQGVGTSATRQCSRGHNSLPESSRASRQESN